MKRIVTASLAVGISVIFANTTLAKQVSLESMEWTAIGNNTIALNKDNNFKIVLNTNKDSVNKYTYFDPDGRGIGCIYLSECKYQAEKQYSERQEFNTIDDSEDTNICFEITTNPPTMECDRHLFSNNIHSFESISDSIRGIHSYDFVGVALTQDHSKEIEAYDKAVYDTIACKDMSNGTPASCTDKKRAEFIKGLED